MMDGDFMAKRYVFENIIFCDFTQMFQLIVEFPYNVAEFYTDDSRLVVETDGADNTSGKRFTIKGLSGNKNK